MSWVSYLSNSGGITAVYGGTPPPLTRVRLHEIGLDYERGLLRLRFDLAGFPENPPRKWVDAGFNVVQLDVQVAGVRSIDIRGSGLGEPQGCEMRLESSASLEVGLESEHFTLNCQAQAAMLARISAYLDEIPFQ